MIPSPTINSIQLGSINLHIYGFIIAMAITVAYILAQKIAKKKHFSPDEIDTYFFIVIPIAIVCARIYHIVTNLSVYIQNPVSSLAIWNGGLGILGAIMGGAITLYILSKKYKRPFLQITDFLVPLLALGQAIGRWGNYVNQELYGKPTNLPWGLKIDVENRINTYKNFETFHPTFLYESILSLLNFAILFLLSKKTTLKTGTITALYAINYGIIRLIIEFFKIDPDIDSTLGPLRIPQYLSIVLICFGIVLLIKNKNNT